MREPKDDSGGWDAAFLPFFFFIVVPYGIIKGISNVISWVWNNPLLGMMLLGAIVGVMWGITTIRARMAEPIPHWSETRRREEDH